MADNKDGIKEEPNFWQQILTEVSSRSTKKVPKRVLVLGNNGCGKTSLILKLRAPGEEELKKGAGLEFSYLDVHDEERDDYARLSIWVQDGNPKHNDLIKYVIKKDTVYNTMILICTDMSQPWDLVETLEYWSSIIQQHIHSLKLSAKELNEMERSIIKKFREYKDMNESNEENKRSSVVINPDEQIDDSLEPLGENILLHNFGIPVTVVVTKTDAMSTLEKDDDFRDEQFDFIQKHLRKFCLKCGAGLIYTSSKDGTNLNNLYKYLVHQLYGFPLKIPPQIVDKDSIFIPMGWDNESKIAILDDHIKSFSSDDAFRDHIVKIQTKKSGIQEKEVIAEDEQIFLEAQMTTLNKAPASMPGQRQQPPTDLRVSPRTPSLTPGQRVAPRSGIPNPKAKIDPSKAAAAQGSSETVLANFFNSLLNKNTGSKSAKPSSGATPAAARSDVQAELERMSKKTIKKESSG